jgi:hypothetical protein
MFKWRLLVEDAFSQPDLIIAATALHHGLTVVSRDVSEYQKARAPVLNPWVDPLPAAPRDRHTLPSRCPWPEKRPGRTSRRHRAAALATWLLGFYVVSLRSVRAGMTSPYRIERDRGTKEARQQLAVLREKWPLAFPVRHQDIRPLAMGVARQVAIGFPLGTGGDADDRQGDGAGSSADAPADGHECRYDFGTVGETGIEQIRRRHRGRPHR